MRKLLIYLCLCFMNSSGAVYSAVRQSGKEAVIYRDDWGIPHIYADSFEALSFAFGYVQAEDRLDQILKSYRYSEGTLSEAFGKPFLEMDYSQRIWRHMEISRERFHELPLEIQNECRAFVNGIKKYMSEHPDKVPDWAPEIHPWHPIAYSRNFIWDWSLDQALDDLQRGRKEPEPPHNSNQWIVAGKRTENGAPVALIDPHLSFETTGHWYEASLHMGDFHVCGVSLIGTPYIGLGHNQYLSWAATTGGPDCGDVYVLEIAPDDTLKYRYDDTWRDISQEKLIFRYRDSSGLKEETRTVERCHYGPIVLRQPGKGFAVRLPYEFEVSLAEQMLLLNRSKNLEQAKKALAMCQLMPQNMMIATVEGDIYYLRTGRVPIRPQGYNWDYPVPGNTKDTEWQGIHPQEDLVQITNPDCGFMQNCNISPGTMMPDSPLKESLYTGYIYNDSEARSNTRGRSALRLLGTESRLTVDRAKEIALDTSVDQYKIWIEVLDQVFSKHKESYAHLEDQVGLLSMWDGRLDKDNPQATLFRFWRRYCNRKQLTLKDLANESNVQSQLDLLTALDEAQKYLTDKFGTYRIPWGETVRIQRGEKSWPVSGGSFEEVNVLRAAWGDFNPKTGITLVRGGQSYCMLVILKKPVESFSILPWGESDDPSSSHYADQTDKLFSGATFKSTYFSKEELMQHLESEKKVRME